MDDTLFRRSGKKVWAASWFHDGSAHGPKKVGFGNNWVIVGIVVTLPFIDRPVCLPVAARLVVKNTTSASRLWLARRMVEDLARALPDRKIHVVAIYRTQFGVLRKYERVMQFDANGRQVPKEVLKDVERFGVRADVGRYEMPFTGVDREAEMTIAYAVFSRRLGGR